jgi:regulator of protease activity HflC (stomatin/prohibitin superfamily)
VPTSIAKLSFRADQVTREKVGVEVTGLAVYRVVDPMLAYRMLDTDRSNLTEILRDMFVGATRRIVASLCLEECLTHRKERVAAALLAEIAPVLAGYGSSSDSTATGWGVVLDTIEIQDVKVLSKEVFARLQAPYREALTLRALVAREEVEREQARLAAERNRSAEQARRELMAEEEARLDAERKREVEAQSHAELLERRALEATLLRLREKSEAERARAEIELAARRAAGELEAELIRRKRAALAELSEARLTEIMLTETLPRVAEAFRGSFDRVNLTSTDGDRLFAFLSAGVEQVLGAARVGGVSLPGRASRQGCENESD